MPSLWTWLCFPNRRNGGKVSRRDSKTRRTEANDHSSSRKRKSRCQADHIRVTKQHGHDDAFVGVVDNKFDGKGSAQPLVSHTSTKRRRVQEVFNLPEDIHAHVPNDDRLDISELNRNNYQLQNRRNNNFGSEYTPKIYQSHSEHSHAESMYGYVPKAVQSVYASRALEGRRIDDYFDDTRGQNSWAQYGNTEQDKRTPALVSKLTLSKPSSCSSITAPDKISLLEPNANDIEIGMSDEQNEWNGMSDISARFESILNASFDTDWNNKEEVLY